MSIDALIGAADRALIAIDYDGTLAPIVDDPADAVPAPGALAALASCVHRFAHVAIVTGRPAETLLNLVGADDAAALDGLIVVGHYGLERWTAGTGLVTPAPHPGVAEVRAGLDEVLADAPDDVRVEDKGHSLAVHTRETADPAGVLARLTSGLEHLATSSGLAVQPGKFVLELRPPGSDKGHALRAVIEETDATAVLYAGDDVGDGPAFAVVDEVRARGGVGVRVLADSPEAPNWLREHVDVLVDGPAGLVALLEEISGAVR